MTADRHEPGFTDDEMTMLRGWLDYHRATLLMKCEGLSDEQLRERAVAPSKLTLLGLVRHMAEVERWWFRSVFAGETVPDLFCDDETNRDGDFDDVDTADVAADLATFRAECDAGRAVVTAADSADAAGVYPRTNSPIKLRWVMTHMIEEYARHNGHADILREQIDGTTGD
jgi:uncharacterized damage-inducible protein DinB